MTPPPDRAAVEVVDAEGRDRARLVALQIDGQLQGDRAGLAWLEAIPATAR